MSAYFTLTLTSGMFPVRADVARAIREAMIRGDRYVDVDIDLAAGPDSSRATMIAIGHVVALAETKQIKADFNHSPRLKPVR